MSNTDEKIFSITKELVDSRRRETFPMNSMLFEEGLLDSLGLMKLLSEIEEEFGITVNTDDLTAKNFASVNNTAELIKKYLQIGPS